VHKTTIHIVTTGGTIEKSYDELDGTLENRTSVIRQRLTDRLRLPYSELKFHSLFAKDSLDFTEKDRSALLKALMELQETQEPIVVLHGTDTMSISLAYCQERLRQPSAAIIFTGAMRPLGFENSDALQNVTEALYAAKLAAPGFYISFHGQLFAAPRVRKNKEAGTFESY